MSRIYVRIILISPGCTTFQRVNWTEAANPFLSSFRRRRRRYGATLLARDPRPLPSRDPGSAEFYPSSTKSKSAVPTGYPQPNRLLPGANHDHDPGIYDMSMYAPRA